MASERKVIYKMKDVLYDTLDQAAKRGEKAVNVCKVYDSDYGGYYGELDQFAGFCFNARMGTYHCSTIKAMKDTVSAAWDNLEIKFIRIR